jgi:hypothetical protein
VTVQLPLLGVWLVPSGCHRSHPDLDILPIGGSAPPIVRVAAVLSLALGGRRLASHHRRPSPRYRLRPPQKREADPVPCTDGGRSSARPKWPAGHARIVLSPKKRGGCCIFHFPFAARFSDEKETEHGGLSVSSHINRFLNFPCELMFLRRAGYGPQVLHRPRLKWRLLTNTVPGLARSPFSGRSPYSPSLRR